MATLEQMQQALINADRAGDVESARILAGAIKNYNANVNSPSIMDNTMPGEMKDIAKGAGSGAVEGAASLMGFPRDIINMMPNAPKTGPIPSTADITEFLGSDYKPLTKEGEYAKSIAAGAAGGALTSKLRMLPAAMGAVSGASSQAAGDASGDNPVARFFGGVAPYVLGAPFGLRTPNVVKATKKYMREVGDDQLDIAAAVKKNAEQRLGTSVLLNQAFDEPNSLSAISAEIQKSPGGAILRKVLSRQLPVGQEKIDEMIAGLRGAEPSQEAANAIQAAGTKAVERPGDVASYSSGKYYRKAAEDEVPAADVAEAIRRVGAARENMQIPKNSIAGRVFSQTEKQLSSLQEPILNSEGQALLGPNAPLRGPVTKKDMILDEPSALEIDQLKREKYKTLQSPTLDPAKEVALNSVANILRQTAQEQSPNLAKGANIYGRWKEALVNPMEQSAMTTMFPKGARQSGKGEYNTFSQIFDSDRFGPSDVRFAAENLNRADPQAWPSIVKQNMMAKLSEAAAPVEGRTPETLFDSFTRAIRGSSPQQKAMFNETMAGVAKANREDPQAVVKGANTLMDALEVAARDRSAIGQIDTGEFQRLAGTNWFSATTRGLNFIQPFRAVGRALERHVYQSTYKKIADALVDPEGVNMLKEIAKYDPSSERAQKIVRALLVSNAETQLPQ